MLPVVSSCAVSIQTSPRLCSFPWHTWFFLAEAFHSSIPSLGEQLGATLGAGVLLSNTDKNPALLKLIFWGGVVQWNGL